MLFHLTSVFVFLIDLKLVKHNNCPGPIVSSVIWKIEATSKQILSIDFAVRQSDNAQATMLTFLLHIIEPHEVLFMLVLLWRSEQQALTCTVHMNK